MFILTPFLSPSPLQGEGLSERSLDVDQRAAADALDTHASAASNDIAGSCTVFEDESCVGLATFSAVRKLMMRLPKDRHL